MATFECIDQSHPSGTVQPINHSLTKRIFKLKLQIRTSSVCFWSCSASVDQSATTAPSSTAVWCGLHEVIGTPCGKQKSATAPSGTPLTFCCCAAANEMNQSVRLPQSQARRILLLTNMGILEQHARLPEPDKARHVLRSVRSLRGSDRESRDEEVLKDALFPQVHRKHE